MLFVFVFGIFLELIPLLQIRDTAYLCGEAGNRIAYYHSFRAIFVGSLFNFIFLLINRVIVSLD
jgi:hypothetical protein